jgi:hypothetical protein
MRMTWRLVLMLWCMAAACGVFVACDGGAREPSDNLDFAVVDSLLGPAFVVPQAGKQVNPPRGFAPVPDSIFSLLWGRLEAGLGPDAGLEMVGCFLDSAYPAGLVVSVIDTLNLSGDTGTYFRVYGTSLRDSFRECEVREGEYRVHDIFVKNYLLTDSAGIRFQLLCLSETGHALELMYFAPRSIYPQYIKCFESSIGSLQLINQGGSP